MRYLQAILRTVLTLVLLGWASFVVVRHFKGDIVFTGYFGWSPPHVREVRYFLPRGDAMSELKEAGYWFGGDIDGDDYPEWVLVLPCPPWMGTVGGNWIGSRGAYSKWLPTI